MTHIIIRGNQCFKIKKNGAWWCLLIKTPSGWVEASAVKTNKKNPDRIFEELTR